MTGPATPGDGPATPEAAGDGRRGRPRSAAADTAIIEAVLRLIEEGASIGDLSMEGIARAAGVGKATVYRRWPGKDALLLDVIRSLDDDLPPACGESVRDDLVAMLEHMRRRGLVKRHSAVFRSVLTHVQAQPAVWREYHETVIRARREAMHAVLRRGMARGEIRADRDVDVLADLFVGPMMARALIDEGKALPEGLAEQIVDTVLEGVRPRP